jgi:hypothetical protein
LAPAIVGAFYLRKSSGNLAMFAAILRASFDLILIKPRIEPVV